MSQIFYSFNLDKFNRTIIAGFFVSVNTCFDKSAESIYLVRVYQLPKSMVKIPLSVLQKHQLTSSKGCNLDIKGKYYMPDEIFAFIKKKNNYL